MYMFVVNVSTVKQSGLFGIDVIQKPTTKLQLKIQTSCLGSQQVKINTKG